MSDATPNDESLDSKPQQGQLIGACEELMFANVQQCHDLIQELMKCLRQQDKARYASAHAHLARAYHHIQWAFKAHQFENVPPPSGVIDYPEDESY